MPSFRRLTVALLLAAVPASAAFVPCARALDIVDGVYFVFDIDSDADMRAVGKRSGVQIDESKPRSEGEQQCGNWADQFGVRAYRPVVAGTAPDGSPVWICAGPADSQILSEFYCNKMGMAYVKHVGSVVTCRFRVRG